MGDIELKPGRPDRQRNPDRPISRQAVGSHLKALQQLGLVEVHASLRDGRAVATYRINQARLFVLVEEFRKLSLVGAASEPSVEVTEERAGPGDAAKPALPMGPALVLASGPREGSTYPLQGSGPWVIGREKSAHIALPYDPFASKENTRVHREGARFYAQDMPSSRNGTRVNWRLLQKGEVAALLPGDTLGVGRSLLVFRGG